MHTWSSSKYPVSINYNGDFSGQVLIVARLFPDSKMQNPLLFDIKDDYKSFYGVELDSDPTGRQLAVVTLPCEVLTQFARKAALDAVIAEIEGMY